jgi:hypothetical protein
MLETTKQTIFLSEKLQFWDILALEPQGPQPSPLGYRPLNLGRAHNITRFC